MTHHKEYVCAYVCIYLYKYSNIMHGIIVAVTAEIPFDTYTALCVTCFVDIFLFYIVYRHTSKIKTVKAAEVSNSFVV